MESEPAREMPAAEPRRIALTGDVDPARAAGLVAGDQGAVVLCGEWAGVTVIVASAPLEVVDRGRAGAPLGRATALRGGADDVAVGGGWLGFVGYRAAAAIADPELNHPPARERLPDLALGYYDHLLVRDSAGAWWFEMLWTEARNAELRRRSKLLADRLAALTGAPAATATGAASGAWSATPGVGAHAQAVDACRERIACGDLYQANLALRLRAALTTTPASVFEAGVAALSPQRGAFVVGSWGAIASLSPELLVARDAATLRSEPIKGTRPNPASDPDRSEQLREELGASEKDRSENVMIVDLMRNDLGRVSVPGSVEAGPVCEVRAMAGVWHLVSTVTGDLVPGTGDDAVAAAVLPAGSVTGAPKQAALSVIAELESVERQAFCGSAVLCSPICGLEMSVLIRTLEMAGDEIWLDVGGGITAASDPASEAAECLAKAAPVLRALGAEPPAGVAGVHPGAPLQRLGPTPLPRPGARSGVFTTLLADGGRALHVTEHLARLEASSRELYGRRLPDRIARRIRDAAASSFDQQRLRVTVLPNGEVTIEAFTIETAAETVSLTPVCLPGGLGAHKWADRRLVVAWEERTAPAEPLFCDLDGTVLEASRWSVVADLDGELVTPVADGRILPSIGIATMHQMVRPQPRMLTLADLERARELYVVNAVRGMVPARLASGS
ncbi:MAG: chorismate-binding protein [Baekduia sp.]